MYLEQCEMAQVALDHCVNLLDLNGCMSWVWSKLIVYQSLCVEYGNIDYQVHKEYDTEAEFDHEGIQSIFRL